MKLWHRLLGLFGCTLVRYDGDVYRVHDILGIPVIYVGNYTLPLRPDGRVGYFASERWEHVAGPRI